MKRVYTFYRVSTKRQIVEGDFYMQNDECHAYTDRHDDCMIVKEFAEKGVSEFKVSASKRDAIQEGQQRFESDVNYLVNLMRFWMASDEGKKASTRIKTRIQQLTAEGGYTGGVMPFGYKLVKSGKRNNKGREIVDIEIDEAEAAVIRMIFEKTVREGYDSNRMADYLNGLGIKIHNRRQFRFNSINRILRNRMYCGYFICGDVVSPYLEHIQIIEEPLFYQAQNILAQRAYAENVQPCIFLKDM